MIFAIVPFIVTAQNKYKIEFVGTDNGTCSPKSYGIYVDVANFDENNLNTAHLLFWVSRTDVHNKSIDEILTSVNDYEYVRKFGQFGDPNPQCPQAFSPDTYTFLGCIGDGWGYGHATPEFDVDYFNVYKILPLADINNVIEMGYCESYPIRVANVNNGCHTNYSLSIFIDNGPEVELLPYGNHTNPYIFEPSIINGITENSVVKFKVYYNQDQSVSSPDLLNVDINRCVPVLDPQVQDNLVGIDVTCFGGYNGGITAIFNRAPTNVESMRLTFIRDNNPIHQTPHLTQSDFQGNILTYQNEDEENPLPAGNYQMEWGVSVGNGFILGGTAPVTISEPPAVTGINPITTNVSCEGNNDGEITITPSGGTPPYTYEWTKEGDAFPLPQGSTNTHLVNLSEGNYVSVITDDNGCVSDPIEFLVETTFSSPKLDEGSTLVFQPGTEPQYLPTGSIILGSIVDGSGNYTYHWEKNGGNFQPQNPISLEGLEPATYALVIEDNDSGCLSQQHEFMINELDPLSIEISEIVEITCEGDIGILKAKGIGGTNSYTYLWSTGEQTQSINVGQGIYSVTVTDTSGDELEEQYEFNYSNPLLAVLVHKTDVICKGEATGTIELEITGGTGGPYTIAWLDAPVESSLRSNLGAGEYVYFVSDGECEVTNESEPIVIGEPEEFFTVTKISQTNVTLNGESDGAFEISLDNGLPPYTFSWTKDDQPYEPTVQSTETNLMGLGKGNYQVMVTDAKGCQTTLETPIQINEPDPLAIIELKVTHVGCKGAFTGSITADVTGIAPFTYTWKKQGDISFTAPNQKTITGLSSGTYIVSVSDNSIVPVVTEVVVVTEPDKVLGAMAIPNITECFLGDEGSISINASGGVSPYTYSINGGMDFQDALEFKALSSGTYEVVVLDANQCEYRTSVVLGQPGQTNAEFAMSSQVFAGESVLAIELSHPIPDRVEWVIPDEAIVLEKNPDKLEMVFHEPGEYEVGLMAYSENCLSSKTKKVVVLQGESAIKDASPESTVKKIEHFIVYPNPTNGRFNVGIGLGDTSNIKLSIFGLANNHLIRSEQAFGKKAYDIPMDLIGLPSGLYVIVLETQFGNSLQKIILH